MKYKIVIADNKKFNYLEEQEGEWVKGNIMPFSTVGRCFVYLLEVKFDNKLDKALKDIEVAQDIETPLYTGWLSPTGTLIPASEYDHDAAALMHGTSADRLLERGYVHVGCEGSTFSFNSPTQSQIDWLWDTRMENLNTGLGSCIQSYLDRET